LILGETGTGKEVIARAVHNLSHAKNAPLSKSTAPPSPRFAGSRIVRHERGAFTGAINQKSAASN